MGVVYLGTAKDGAQVAIKVLRPELADDREFRVRFRREVSLLAKVQGLCTVRVIEADTESARPFLATEYVDGPSLSEFVAGQGPLQPEMLDGLAIGLAEALTAIHAAGVIHRDLKPSNVLLTKTGPKVIDFGIAQALDATVVTRTGMVVGSPGFMAPEQGSRRARPPRRAGCGSSFRHLRAECRVSGGLHEQATGYVLVFRCYYPGKPKHIFERRPAGAVPA
jgi:serine/threonine protein kinase